MHPMRISTLSLLLITAALAVDQHLENPNQSSTKQPQQCNFSQYISWEFQLDLPPEKCQGSRLEMLNTIDATFHDLQANSSISFKLYNDTLRTSVFDQVSTAVTTLDGRPLSDTEFPLPDFNGPAFIRHRRKFAFYNGKIPPPLTFIPLGTGDLSLKVKNVSLDWFTPLNYSLDFPKKNKKCGERMRGRRYHWPRLKWKIENDIYCSVNRPTCEANYHPIKLKKPGIYTYDEAEACFPGIWNYFKIDRHLEELLEYNKRHLSKSVWEIKMGEAPGVAIFVVSYPTLLDALTGGANAVDCELSFRIKKSDGRGGKLSGALSNAVAVSEIMHEKGWDTGVH